jgi:hypothetical protein
MTKNKNFIKSISSLAILFFIFFYNFQNAFANTTAQNLFENFSRAAGSKGAGYKFGSSPAIIIGQILLYALTLVGVIFLALTIYAGFLWMTAGGNEEKIKKAKGMLTNAIIGLIIIMASYIITDYVLKAITSAVGMY